MPNTEVKLLSADGSWGFPPVRVGRCQAVSYHYSAVAQLVEHSAVNRTVVGSSPTCGAILWRAVRVAEGARLEIVYTLTAYQGFKSLALRHLT